LSREWASDPLWFAPIAGYAYPGADDISTAEVFAARMTVSPTEIQSRLRQLPERHLAALRAALGGFSDADIAGLLGIPVESVPTTVRLAAAKLTGVLVGSAPTESPVTDDASPTPDDGSEPTYQ
jgi:DNA-directed RNA polymerase specialized sigma24 family protein